MPNCCSRNSSDAPRGKGLFIAGTGSNAGKTAAALGLIAALRRRGQEVQAAKAGPDFLDAAWLSLATGRPTPNLDLFMGPNGGWRRCWRRFGGMGVVEGAMGLFDGDAAGASSGAALAQALGYPILLVVNARALGQSAAAIAQGFLHYRPPSLSGSLCFCGLICSHVASERHWRILARALEPVCAAAQAPLAGYLPVAGAPRLESRHLGLKQACECEADMAAIGDWFSGHVDLEAILRRCDAPVAETAPVSNGPADVVIAIARDEAFAFCYADLPLLLAELGAETVFFSPLRHSSLPRCHGVYIPGGYPELYADALAANEPLKAALRRAAASGMPIYGECGGYMYLLERLTDAAGRVWPMLGLLPGAARMEEKLAALGYRQGASGEFGGPVYGHEFHYARGGASAGPVWRWADAEGREMTAKDARRGNVIGSWVHLYPEGSRPFWENWLDLARKFRAGGM